MSGQESSSVFPGSAASAMQGNPVIENAIGQIVAEVGKASAQLVDVRPPRAELKAGYEEAMQRAAATRNKGLLYPYLGSGLGNGALVELGDGSVKWDMIAGIGVHFFGHSHPELLRVALESSLEDTVKHGNLQSGFGAYAFSERLIRLAGRNSRLKYAYLSTSGAMANENALKICYQKHAPACRVLAFEQCFMGRSTTMIQIGDRAAPREGIPLNVHVDYMPFWNEAAVRAAGGEKAFIDATCRKLEAYIERYPKQHACFIFELVQGEGGFNKGKREFFKALMEICKRAGIAVWDDEIQSFGRTTEMFAYEAYGLGEYVDVFCVGKMTQVCATLYTAEYEPKPTLLSGTFTGASVDFAVGSKVLELLGQSDFYGPQGKFAQHYARFDALARGLIAKHPEWFPAVETVPELCDGIGGMMRLTPFGGAMEKVMEACHRCFEEGVVLFWCGHGPYHIRMLPPLGVMALEDWPRVFECIERGFARVAA